MPEGKRREILRLGSRRKFERGILVLNDEHEIRQQTMQTTVLTVSIDQLEMWTLVAEVEVE